MSKTYQRIFICAGGPNSRLDREILGEMDYIIGVDRGALKLVETGIPVDLALGDFDSVNRRELEIIKEQSGEMLYLEAEKDWTDLQVALNEVLRRFPQMTQLLLTGIMGGGRLDHTLSNIWIGVDPRYQKILNKLVVIEDSIKCQFFKPGCHQLEYETDWQYVSLIGLTPLKKLEIQGAKYELRQQDFCFPPALISNEYREGIPIRIQFESGIIALLWIKEEKNLGE